ncbi:MAG: 50S ribosomal protein L13e [Desulfurococcales archaeon]|nr:50S ribosomal protein L13e [Desulfurococcales archaeon]
MLGVPAEVPKPLVKKPRLIKDRGISVGLREGRGFSLGELKAVGLTVEEARRLGIPVDRRRRSAHEWNIKILQEYLNSIKSGK